MPNVFCDNDECIHDIDGKCVNDTVDLERSNYTDKESLMCNSFQEWE